MTNIKRATTEDLARALASEGDCQLIDVREPAEFESERIEGARLAPLSEFDRLQHELDGERPVHVLCRSGNRAERAAEKLVQQGYRDVRVVDGGLLAWVTEGREVERSENGVWSLERQIRFAAGSLVAAGVVGGFLVHPALFAVSGAVGAGLVFAAVTDTCAMGMLLARMPWNRRGGAAAECSVGQAKQA